MTNFTSEKAIFKSTECHLLVSSWHLKEAPPILAITPRYSTDFLFFAMNPFFGYSLRVVDDPFAVLQLDFDFLTTGVVSFGGLGLDF